MSPGMHVMNGVPVKLDFLADTIGDIDYWWVTTTFVDHPEVKLMKFHHHQFYKPLHGGKT